MSTYNKEEVSLDICGTALSDAELENIFGGGGIPFGPSGAGLGAGAATANSFSNNAIPWSPLTPIIIVNTLRNDNQQRRRRFDDHHFDDWGNDGHDGQGDW